MKKVYHFFSLCLLVAIIASAPLASLSAQDTASLTFPETPTGKSSVFAGTQIPLQFSAGYNYRFTEKISATAQAGFISKPYSGFIVDAMEAFGMDKYLSQVIRKSFESGTVLGIGPNVHFDKYHVGVFGQYMHLKAGGITPADALSIHFQRDFSQFNLAALPLFVFEMQSNIMNVGVLAGRSFKLRNPAFSIDTEIGIAKVVGSKNSFASNRALVDQTAFARDLYKGLDQSMRDAYLDHGYIPTLNLYLVYHLQ